MNYFGDRQFIYFVIISFITCLIYAIVFQPITWQISGDAGAYIELAKQFLGISERNIDLSHRQPLYSFILAIFILVFGESEFIYPIMYFQFFLVFVSSLIVYKIFDNLGQSKKLSLFAGTLYIINFSTLYYAFNILTETLALFLFVLIVYLLILVAKNQNLWLLLLLGLLNGLIVLARFNALGVPIISLFCLFLIHYRYNGFKKLKLLVKPILSYGFVVLFVLNLWCLYNYSHRGFYGILPSYHLGQRWAIPATINETNTVNEEYEPILEIFLNARQEFFQKVTPIEIKKGSLVDYKILKNIYSFFKPQANGYHIYKLAKPKLLNHYNLRNTSKDIATLGEKLKPFYNHISKQNKRELLKLRIYSLFVTFKASGTTLPTNENLNLNILPDLIFKIYKIIFIFINLFVFIFSLYVIICNAKNIRKYDNWFVFLIIFMILYFPFVHFYANVLGDANRFKFPSEPLIFGLFIYYLIKLKRRYFSKFLISK